MVMLEHGHESGNDCANSGSHVGMNPDADLCFLSFRLLLPRAGQCMLVCDA
jgi:hypothetical protein